MQVKAALLLIFVCLLVGPVVEAQKDEGVEDYGPEPLADEPNAPKDGKAGGDPNAADDPNKVAEPEEEDKTKTKFSDDRFAKLFPSRPGARQLSVRPVAKPKPTLPSWVKSTPPLLKAQVVTTPAPRGGRVRQAITQATTPRGGRAVTSTTTRRPLQGRSTPRQLAGRLSTSRPTSAPSGVSASTSPSAAALAAARRNRNGGINRFRTNSNSLANNNQQPNNSTIPALNPRRN